MQVINYSALPASSKNFKLGKQKILGPIKIITTIIVIIFLTLLCILGFGFIQLLPQPLPVVIIILIPVGLLSIAIHRSNQRRKHLSKFIADNNWQEFAGTPPRAKTEALGLSLTTSKVSGNLDSVPFWVTTAVPQFSEIVERDTSTVLILEMPKQLPTLLVAPNKGINTEVNPLATIKSIGLSRLRLEGDFDQWLRLYGINGKEVETLSYITPDVMAVFVDEVTNKIIYYDRYIYIFTDLLDEVIREKYAKVFDEAQHLIKEVLEKQI
jgi:hypothetical protein